MGLFSRKVEGVDTREQLRHSLQARYNALSVEWASSRDEEEREKMKAIVALLNYATKDGIPIREEEFVKAAMHSDTSARGVYRCSSCNLPIYSDETRILVQKEGHTKTSHLLCNSCALIKRKNAKP